VPKKNKNKTSGTAARKEAARDRAGISLKRFALTYLGLMGAFFSLIAFKPIQNIIDLNGLYTAGVITATTKVLDLAGIACTHHGSILSLPSISLDIKFGCNGLEAVMIYSVAVIAFPASWKKRLFGIIAGFVVIQVVNVLRIAALAYSGIHFRQFFDYIHLYVAQGLMIAVSLGIFFLYLHYARNDSEVAT
jgi:exosortase H (IPTLxxWG-CTERM-specific)